MTMPPQLQSPKLTDQDLGALARVAVWSLVLVLFVVCFGVAACLTYC